MRMRTNSFLTTRPARCPTRTAAFFVLWPIALASLLRFGRGFRDVVCPSPRSFGQLRGSPCSALSAC
eukprot:1197664-Prymnesium_polylepis.1